MLRIGAHADGCETQRLPPRSALGSGIGRVRGAGSLTQLSQEAAIHAWVMDALTAEPVVNASATLGDASTGLAVSGRTCSECAFARRDALRSARHAQRRTHTAA